MVSNPQYKQARIIRGLDGTVGQIRHWDRWDIQLDGKTNGTDERVGTIKAVVGEVWVEEYVCKVI